MFLFVLHKLFRLLTLMIETNRILNIVDFECFQLRLIPRSDAMFRVHLITIKLKTLT